MFDQKKYDAEWKRIEKELNRKITWLVFKLVLLVVAFAFIVYCHVKGL